MKSRRIFAGCLLLVSLAGCQSTTIRSAWFDTDFAGPPMRKVVVAGQFASLADERTLEDAVVAQLRAKGVDALSGHAARLDDPKLSETDFRSAVVATGADGLLLVTLLGVDTRTQVTTTMVSGGMGWGRNPWGPGPWGPGGWGATTWTTVPAQQISQYDLATVETKLFDLRTRQLVWAATTTTFNPRSVAREAPGFADLIVGQLASRQIVAAK